MQYKPKKKIAPAALLAGSLLGTAFVFVILIALDAGLLAVNLPSALLLAGAGLLVLRRYLLTDFVYTIAPATAFAQAQISHDEPRPLLLFHLVIGKSSRRLGVLSLSDCEKLLPLTRKNKKIARKGRKCGGDLRSNFAARDSHILLYHEGDEARYLLFEPDQTFAALLSRLLEENPPEA